MRIRRFGRCGFDTSALGLALDGVDAAGARDAGAAASPGDVAALLERAFASGVDVLAAPAAGDALDAAVRAALVASRHPVRVLVPLAPAPGAPASTAVRLALDRLGRDRLDVAVVDHAAAFAAGGVLAAALRDERAAGRVERLGLRVRDPADALAALERDDVDVLCLRLDLLDQRAVDDVLPAAERRGVAVVVESALADGALCAGGPPPGDPGVGVGDVAAAVERAARWARRNGLSLAEGALRFCLSQREVSTVLAGAWSAAALDAALAAAAAPELPRHKLSDARPIALASR